MCSRSDDRHCGDNDTQNLSVRLKSVSFLVFKVRILLV